MRKLSEFCDQLTPVADAVGTAFLEDIDMRGRAPQIFLQLVSKAVVNGEADDQCHHAGGNANDRDRGDNRYHGFLTLGTQITAGAEGVEFHNPPSQSSLGPRPSSIPVW